MKERFYTAEQKDVLKEHSFSKDAKRTTITESTGARILDALGEQQDTLQNIERILQRIEGNIQPQSVDIKLADTSKGNPCDLLLKHCNKRKAD